MWYSRVMIWQVIRGLIERSGESISEIDKKLRLNGELEGALNGGVFTNEMLTKLSEYFCIDLFKVRRIVK